MTAALLCLFLGAMLATLAVIMESGRRVGGITFYRLGRYRFTFCRSNKA